MDPLSTILYIYSFIAGCCIASFINVVIYRLPKHISFSKGRSFCPQCQKTLKGYDMIPILSWFLLKGRCRYCKKRISFRYPFIELLGGLLAILCFYQYQISWMTILSFIISMLFLAITMIDLDTMTIPDELVIIVGIVSIVSYFIQPQISLLSRLIGMVCISMPMFLLTILIPDSFGGGDIKLLFVAGFLLGWQNTLLAFFIAIMVAGVYACYVLVRKQKDRKGHIAFGPYLCIGIFIALLQGTNIMHWYLSLFIR